MRMILLFFPECLEHFDGKQKNRGCFKTASIVN